MPDITNPAEDDLGPVQPEKPKLSIVKFDPPALEVESFALVDLSKWPAFETCQNEFLSDKPLYRPNEGYPILIEDPACIGFMLRDLADSGLKPADIGAYPVAPLIGAGGIVIEGYCIPYTLPGKHAWHPVKRPMWVIRYNRAYDKYIGPSGYSDIWTPLGQSMFPQSGVHTIIIVVEGEKKAAKAKKRDPSAFVIGLRGVAGGRDPAKSGTGQTSLHPLIEGAIRRSTINLAGVFDADVTRSDLRGEANAFIMLASSCMEPPRTAGVFRPVVGKGLDDALVKLPEVPLTSAIVPVILEATISVLIKPLNLAVTSDLKLRSGSYNAQRLHEHNFSPILKNDLRQGLLLEGTPIAKAALLAVATEKIQSPVYLNQPMADSNIAKGLDHMLALMPQSDRVLEYFEAQSWNKKPQLYCPNLDEQAGWDGVGKTIIRGTIPQLCAEGYRIMVTTIGLRLRRAMKADIATFLYAAQGAGKSTLCKNLAYVDGHSYHSNLSDIGSEDGAFRTLGPKLRKAMVVEIAEAAVLETARQQIQEILKMILGDPTFEYRASNDKELGIIRLLCAFVATSNKARRLPDQTGNRRWLPMEVLSFAPHWRIPMGYHAKANAQMIQERDQHILEVLARADDIASSPWYNINLQFEDLPPDVQQLAQNVAAGRPAIDVVLSMYTKRDPFYKTLLLVLEDYGRELPHFGAGPEEIICLRAKDLLDFLELQKLDDDIKSVTQLNRLLETLSENPSFPYKVTNNDRTDIKFVHTVPGTKGEVYMLPYVVRNADRRQVQVDMWHFRRRSLKELADLEKAISIGLPTDEGVTGANGAET